ncbi:hypothetical protein [Pseudarthrobacter sp. S9]|uniref:hypothetical protein n=1 Tax=Pseudarthrobacter sp. S9 TaxID=3418421 RepID=UPI003D0385C4
MKTSISAAWLPFLLAIFALIFCQFVQWAFSRLLFEYVKKEWMSSNKDGEYDPLPNLGAEALQARFNRDSDGVAVASVSLVTAPGILVLFDNSSAMFAIIVVILTGLPLSVILVLFFTPPTTYARFNQGGISLVLLIGIIINLALVFLALYMK